MNIFISAPSFANDHWLRPVSCRAGYRSLQAEVSFRWIGVNFFFCVIVVSMIYISGIRVPWLLESALFITVLLALFTFGASIWASLFTEGTLKHFIERLQEVLDIPIDHTAKYDEVVQAIDVLVAKLISDITVASRQNPELVTHCRKLEETLLFLQRLGI